MMKRLGALLLLLLLMMTTAQAEASRLDRACDLARLLDEMASAEAYISLMSGSEEINAQVSTWGEGDHDVPVAAYAITVDPEALARLLGEDAGKALAGLSDGLRRQACKQLIRAVPSMLSSYQGATTLAAASLCQVSTAFPCDDLTGDALYLLIYRDTAPVMVCFTVEEDGVASANATFLAGEQAAAIASAADVSALLSMLPGIQVEALDVP